MSDVRLSDVEAELRASGVPEDLRVGLITAELRSEVVPDAATTFIVAASN